MKVAVVGGGMVGRIAAWGVMQAGHAPTIFDRTEYALVPRGFVYIHDNMDLPLTEQRIFVQLQGSATEYSKKVYGGKLPIEEVSFAKFSGEQIGYDPAQMLGMLNGIQHGMREDRNFENFEEVKALFYEGYEKIIFTLPLNLFFKGNYPSVRGCVGTWPLNAGENLENWCVYNACEGIPWYRAGAMFGYAFREFPKKIAGHQPITKVIDGDPPPEIVDVTFTGRFGAWRKKALSHETYIDAIRACRR